MNTYTTNTNKARSLADMQQIARNQLRLRSESLFERAELLKEAIEKVESVTSWEAWEKLAVTIDDDAGHMTALVLLGECYDQMSDPDGGYF